MLFALEFEVAFRLLRARTIVEVRLARTLSNATTNTLVLQFPLGSFTAGTSQLIGAEYKNMHD